MSMEPVRLGMNRGWESFKGAIKSLPEKASKGWSKVSEAMSYMKGAITDAFHSTCLYKMLSQRTCKPMSPKLKIIKGITEEYGRLYDRFTGTAKNLGETKKQLQALESDKGELETQLQTERKRTAFLSERSGTQQTQITDQQEQVRGLQQQLENLQAKQERMQAAIANAQSNLENA